MNHDFILSSYHESLTSVSNSTPPIHGLPISGQHVSSGGQLPHGSLSAQHTSSLNQAGTVSNTQEVFNAFNVLDGEGELARDYTCCGTHFRDLHALVEHFEQVHVPVLDFNNVGTTQLPVTAPFNSHARDMTPLQETPDCHQSSQHQHQQHQPSFDELNWNLGHTTHRSRRSSFSPSSYGSSSAGNSPLHSRAHFSYAGPHRSHQASPYTSRPSSPYSSRPSSPHSSQSPSPYGSQPPSPLGSLTSIHGLQSSRTANYAGQPTIPTGVISPQAVPSPTSSTIPPLLSKPFKCPKPGCNKSYKQANGLKYHMTHGSCNFRPSMDLEHVKDVLERRRREKVATAVHPSDGLGEYTESELREAEREAEKRLRPFACGVGDCTRRYKNINGLRYHYQHSGDHGALGLAMLAQGTHESLGNQFNQDKGRETMKGFSGSSHHVEDDSEASRRGRPLTIHRSRASRAIRGVDSSPSVASSRSRSRSASSSRSVSRIGTTLLSISPIFNTTCSPINPSSTTNFAHDYNFLYNNQPSGRLPAAVQDTGPRSQPQRGSLMGLERNQYVGTQEAQFVQQQQAQPQSPQQVLPPPPPPPPEFPGYQLRTNQRWQGIEKDENDIDVFSQEMPPPAQSTSGLPHHGDEANDTPDKEISTLMEVDNVAVNQPPELSPAAPRPLYLQPKLAPTSSLPIVDFTTAPRQVSQVSPLENLDGKDFTRAPQSCETHPILHPIPTSSSHERNSQRDGRIIAVQDHESLTDKAIAWLRTLFNDNQRYRKFLSLRTQRDPAQRLVDILQEILDLSELRDPAFRREVVVTLQKFAGSDIYPSSYRIEEPIVLNQKDYMGSGGFGEIFRVQLGGKTVCVKAIRLPDKSDSDKLARQFLKEAILWAQLHHPNIVPFLGFHDFYQRPCLISPWMGSGHINSYLQNNFFVNRYLLVRDITSGLGYLHSWGVVHGDLKGANVLVDEHGHALLTDFGISSVFDAALPHWTSQSKVGSKGGSARWQAPELLDSNDDQDVYNTKATDVYAWGCTCYELFTGKVPFHEIPRDVTVMFRVTRDGLQPSRPQADDHAWLIADLQSGFWSIMEGCWAKDPMKRPSVEELLVTPQLVDLSDDRHARDNLCQDPAQYRAARRTQRSTCMIQEISGLLDAASDDT